MTLFPPPTDRIRYVPRAYVALHPITATSAVGSRLTDSDGNTYLDLAGGIGVVNVGHRAPAVVAAIHAQVDQLLHSGPVTGHALYVELARRLSERVGGPDRELQTLFVNSGAEAVETATKVARHATGRPGVIAFERSFHGRTLLTATLTGRSAPHKSQPGSMAPEVYHVPYPYPMRPVAGVAPGRLIDHSIACLDALLETRVPADKIAAVIVEPVQGEGGFVVPPPGFLSRLAEWSRAHGILLIADEIQTGYGRTGRFFAFEHDGVRPDIVTVGKSIAAGLPLAAVVASRELWDEVVVGDVGGTYGGNPVACAAALAVLDIFETEPLVERAASIGLRFLEGLRPLQALDVVGEVRGLGAMLAVEFVEPGSLEPNSSIAEQVVLQARHRGLLVIRTGLRNNIVRLLPPLILTDDEADEGIDILTAAVNAAVVERAADPRVTAAAQL